MVLFPLLRIAPVLEHLATPVFHAVRNVFTKEALPAASSAALVATHTQHQTLVSSSHFLETSGGVVSAQRAPLHLTDTRSTVGHEFLLGALPKISSLPVGAMTGFGSVGLVEKIMARYLNSDAGVLPAKKIGVTQERPLAEETGYRLHRPDVGVPASEAIRFPHDMHEGFPADRMVLPQTPGRARIVQPQPVPGRERYQSSPLDSVLLSEKHSEGTNNSTASLRKHYLDTQTPFKQGNFFKAYRENGSSDSVLLVAKDEVTVGYELRRSLSEAEAIELADKRREKQNDLASVLPRGVVPVLEAVDGGVLRAKAVEGKSFSELPTIEARTRALSAYLEPVGAAMKHFGMTEGKNYHVIESGPLKGWIFKVDGSLHNFRFNDYGDVASWIDPITVAPFSNSRQALGLR